MNTKEASIWQIFNTSGKKDLNPFWLAEVYSPSLPTDLRRAIAERIGCMGEGSWKVLKLLIEKEGVQSELIYAAGLSHQIEAKQWLIALLNQTNNLDIEILQALACWGAEISNKLLREILISKSQHIRLAGLELLRFKSHKLTDKVFLDLVKEPLRDFREPVVLKTIELLRRRDGEIVTSRIAQLVKEGSHSIAKAALFALGSIGTSHSQNALITLEKEVNTGPIKDLLIKQLQVQYRFFPQENTSN